MPQVPEDFDVVVIGAGIAGASVAAELASDLRVALLEQEGQPGYHTTGRSAALFSESYGPVQIRALSRASAAFFDAPPAGFAPGPLLTPRGALMIGRADQVEALDALLDAVAGRTPMERLDAAQTAAMQPLNREDYVAGSVYEPGARDIDVNALHQGYLKQFRHRGGRVETGCEVLALEASTSGWKIETRKGRFTAARIVNAAGAWADAIGAMAGARPIGLVPKRRTAMIVPAPEGFSGHSLPMVVDIGEQFYLKPESGALLVSPADETPSQPCDAQPDELDIAICINRIEGAFKVSIARIVNKWAGLRSFVADMTPVVGFDKEVQRFFWLAGQGGYGIQTAPAIARL